MCQFFCVAGKSEASAEILYEIFEKPVDRSDWKRLFLFLSDASVAQLVEHHLAKVDVEGSNPFARSILF